MLNVHGSVVNKAYFKKGWEPIISGKSRIRVGSDGLAISVGHQQKAHAQQMYAGSGQSLPGTVEAAMFMCGAYWLLED